MILCYYDPSEKGKRYNGFSNFREEDNVFFQEKEGIVHLVANQDNNERAEEDHQWYEMIWKVSDDKHHISDSTEPLINNEW